MDKITVTKKISKVAVKIRKTEYRLFCYHSVDDNTEIVKNVSFDLNPHAFYYIANTLTITIKEKEI